MKCTNHSIVAVLILGLSASPIFAQGPLTPPGPPAPTMKTLQQIEPRTPISSVPVVITTSGSYYLTTNLNAVSGNGITISANNVSLDLNGFALTASGAGTGITLPSTQTNVTVRNGSVSGWVYGVVGNNAIVEHLTVSSCSSAGIRCTSSSQVRNCICAGNSGNGITVDTDSLITDCIASGNGSFGIQATHSIVRNCRAANNGQSGIYISTGAVSGCSAESNGGSGIYINLPGTEVIGNVCNGNNSGANASNAGIYVNDSNNRIEDNHVTLNGYAGISVAGFYSGNLVVKNYVSGNGANNYLTPGNQVVGPLITTFGTISSSSPWANFSF